MSRAGYLGALVAVLTSASAAFGGKVILRAQSPCWSDFRPAAQPTLLLAFWPMQ